MNLHIDKKLFLESIQITAQQVGIPEIYIEKDYWVTLALKTTGRKAGLLYLCNWLSKIIVISVA